MKVNDRQRICPVVVSILLLAVCPHVRSENDSNGPAPLRVKSPDGKREVTQSPAREIVIRDLQSGKIIDRRPLGRGIDGAEIIRVVWSPKGTGFMIEVDMMRGSAVVPYHITSGGVVDLNMPPTWIGKLPTHTADELWPEGEFHYPSGGWELLDWPDERHFRMRWVNRSRNTVEDAQVTFQINRRNRVTVAKVEDLLAGKPEVGK